MATLQGKAVKNTYRQVLQIGANNVGVSGSLQPVQDGGGVNTSLSLSTTAATITGTLTINGDLIITGGGIQIQDLIDDTVATLIQNGTGITWAYNDSLRTLTPTITIATADGGVQGDFLQLNTGAGETNAVAKMYWNNVDGTNNLGLMGGNVILPIGQKQVARVLNNSGSILNKAAYQVVKVAAAQGQRLAVALAQANNDANSTDTLGLVAENIANNQEGFITTSGLITDVDTTGDLQLQDWNDGDVLYLSPTTPGAITKVKPVAPQHTIIVGFVVYAHKTQGKIFVKVDNGYEIDELHNVRITNVANDNILQYNSSLAVWENVAGTTTNIAEGTNLYYTQGRFDSAFAAKSTTNLAEGTNLYFTTARGDANFATNFATKDTDDLPEGSTNLYYTNTRTRNALSVTAGTGIAYNSTTGNFNLGSIPNASLTNSSVTVNGLSLALGASITLTTSNIAEGTNLYWTDARFDSRFGTKTTTNLAEGTNLYYTQARFNTAFDAKTTTDLDEGTNLYYTDARSRAAFSENAVGLDYSSGSGILSLTAGYAIPTTVKLGEYDTAYNRSIVSAAVTGTSTKTLSLTQQDANVITASWTDQGITTINGTANQIAANTVGNTTTVGFTNDVTFPNNVVVSGNLTINGTATYVNTQSISSKDPLFEVANDNNTTDAVDIGYYGRYYDSAQTRVEFTGLFRDASDAGKFKFFTGLVDEPTNVVDTTGTGYTVGTLVANVEGNLAGTANAANVLSTARTISATGDAAWSVSFDGSANATAALTLANTGVTASTYGTTTAVPTIAVDSKGRITSASNTNIAFPVLSVNSQSGNVVLTTSNVAEGTNQYFTTGRVAAYLSGAISTVLTTDLTASRAVVSNASGKLVSSATTDTELGYLSGVTSAIQTQLNSKLNLSGGTLTGGLSGTSANFSSSVTAGAILSTGVSTFSRTGLVFTLNPSYGGADVYSQLQSTGALALASGGDNNRLYITNTGNVGIGTTSPNQKLTITDAAYPILGFSIGSTAQGYIGSLAGGGIAINSQIAQPIMLYTNDIERMRITSGGNVGIGNTAPDTSYNAGSWFTGNGLVVGNISSVSGIQINSSTSSTLSAIRFGDGDGANNLYDQGFIIYRHTTDSMLFGSNRSTALTINSVQNIGVGIIDAKERFEVAGLNGNIRLYGRSGINANSLSANIYYNGSAWVRDNASFGAADINFGPTNDSITFRTNAATSGDVTAKMTLNSNGSLQMSNNSTTFSIGSIPGVQRIQYGTGGYTTEFAFLQTNDGYTSIGAGAFNTRSDYRLKEDLKEFSGLSLVTNMKVYDFKWKEKEERNYGFMAHELQEVVPYVVTGTKDGMFEDEPQMQGLDYSKLVPVLVKAIQELKAEIEELKAK